MPIPGQFAEDQGRPQDNPAVTAKLHYLGDEIVRQRASGTSTEAPNRVLNASACRTDPKKGDAFRTERLSTIEPEIYSAPAMENGKSADLA